jgi:branched-chain amino acid transport system substrate-binding protein
MSLILFFGKRKMGKKFRILLSLTVISSGLLFGGGFNSLTQAAEKGPIKIGFIAPSTGNWAQMGMDMVDAFKMYFTEINNTVAGRKIELIVEDESANPATAVTKVRKLITHDKVHLVSGVFIASSGYAVAPICTEEKVPLAITVATADDLTQRKASKYVIRLNYGTSSEFGHAAGDYAYRKLGWRKATIVGMDYAWGHEVGGGFQRTFEDAGGKIIQKVWTPVNTTDYGPYVTSLKSEADGSLDVVTGAATIRLIKAFRQANRDWKIIGPGPITDETFLPALGDDGLGVYSVMPYSGVLELPENIKFKEKVQKFLKKDANAVLATNYTAADWIIRAIKAIDGDVENKDKFLQALRMVEISSSPRGPLKLDKYGQLIQNQYVRRVDKVNNQYQNTVIDTIPNPTQFWNYNPEAFLKLPPYSREYPPCKYCD